MGEQGWQSMCEWCRLQPAQCAMRSVLVASLEVSAALQGLGVPSTTAKFVDGGGCVSVEYPIVGAVWS